MDLNVPSAQVLEDLLEVVHDLEARTRANAVFLNRSDGDMQKEYTSKLQRLEALQDWLAGMYTLQLSRQIRSHAYALSHTQRDERWQHWGEDCISSLNRESILAMAKDPSLRPEWFFEAWVRKNHGTTVAEVGLGGGTGVGIGEKGG